jgi:hypothetical protein
VRVFHHRGDQLVLVLGVRSRESQHLRFGIFIVAPDDVRNYFLEAGLEGLILEKFIGFIEYD